MIKKTSETTPVAASVVNQKNNSTTDAYSCDYENTKIGEIQTELEGLLKTQTVSRNVTMPANTRDYWLVGTLSIPAGYKYLGVLQNNSGNVTSWLTSWDVQEAQGGQVNAQVYSYASSSLSGTLKCTILYIKDFS